MNTRDRDGVLDETMREDINVITDAAEIPQLIINTNAAREPK